MIADLTEYLRSLGPGGEPPDPTDYDAARELLRAVLVREMVRRSLWSAPPDYLGVPGGSCWTRDLLDELVSDCYMELFVRRLSAFENQLLVRDNVDGVIVLGVRNFLHDRQKHNDPLGYKVYDVLRESLGRLHKAGTLWIDGKPGIDGQARLRIRNTTVFSFAAGAPSRELGQADFEARVRAWNDELWPQLITAQGRARSEVRKRLDAHLSRLGEAGVESFYFKDLVKPMKHDVRQRWSQELVALAEEMTSGSDSEGGMGFRELRDCVLRKLEKEPPDEREEVWKLWLFLWTYAAGLNPSEVAAKAERGGRPPATLGLAEELEIARHRIPGLKKNLGRLIRACQSAVSPKASVKEPAEGMSERLEPAAISSYAQRQGLEDMRPTDHDQRLRDATGQAASRWAAGRGEIEQDPRPPRPGDSFVLANDSDLLVEWVVVEGDIDDASLLLVAADDASEVGRCDVSIGSDGGELASIRCGVALRVAAESLDSRHRTGEISAEVLGQVRHKRSAIADGTFTGTLLEREVDEDPEYQRRMEDLGEVQVVLEAWLGKTRQAKVLDLRPRGRGASGTSWLPQALAASILLTLVLGGTTVYQQQRFASLEEELRRTPYPNLPVIWLTADELRRGEDDPFIVSAEARRLALLLEVASPKHYARYRVEVTRGEPGETVWASDALVKSGAELSFDLPRSLLATGHYELRIYGLPAAEEASSLSGPDIVAELLATYSIWIKLE